MRIGPFIRRIFTGAAVIVAMSFASTSAMACGAYPAGSNANDVVISMVATGGNIINYTSQTNAGASRQGMLVYNRSNNSLVVCDGSAWRTLASAGGIAAAGTAGQVQFNSAGVLAADASFVWDNTNKRLGINSATPTTALQIEGTGLDNDDITIRSASGVATNAGGLFLTRSRNTNAAPTAVSAGDNLGDVVFVGHTGGAFVGAALIKGLAEQAFTTTATTQDGALAFHTALDGATAERMRITSGGNVGIGTTNPTGSLVISQTAATAGALSGLVYTGAVNTNQTLSTEIPAVTFTTAGRQWAAGALATQREVLITQPTYSFVGASTITNAATVGIAGAPIQSTNATLTNTHGLLVQAGAVSTATNSYGLTVNAQTGATNNYSAVFLGGNVGIGTAAPSTGLQIDGTGGGNDDFVIRSASATAGSSGQVYLQRSRGTNAAPTAVSASDNLGEVVFGGHNGSAFVATSLIRSLAEQTFSTTASTQDGALTFQTVLDGALNERMRITSGGNVGIGTTNPTGNLAISQTATATGALSGLVYTGAVNTNQTLSTEIPAVTFTTAGRQWAAGALATQREVLITQPTYSFVGASTITNAATVGIAGAPIQSTNATLTNTHGLLVQAGAVSTATNSYGLTVNAQTGATNNYSAAFLGGSVGIGTTAPRNLLHLVQPNSTNQFAIFQGVGSGGTALTSTDTIPVVSSNGFIGYNGLALIPGRWGNATTADSHNVVYIGGAQRNLNGISGSLAFANWGYFTGTTTAAGGLGNATAQGDAVKFDVRLEDGGAEFTQRLNFRSRSATATNLDVMTLYSNGLVRIGSSVGGAAYNLDVQGVASGADSVIRAVGNGNVARLLLQNTGTSGRQWSLSAYKDTLAPNGGFAIADETAAAVRMIFDTSGNVGIGTTTTLTQRLDVTGNIRTTGNIKIDTISTSGTTAVCRDGTNFLTLCSSDERLKENINSITESGLDTILKLRPVTFVWKKDASHKKDAGFIAQEVQKVIPESVGVNEADGLLTFNINPIVSYSVKAIQELKAENDSVKAENAALKAQLEAMDARLKALETK